MIYKIMQPEAASSMDLAQQTPTDSATQMELPSEEWRAIPGYVGYYEASDLGRIRSVGRPIKGRDNVKYQMEGKILKQTLNGKGYLNVTLCVDGQETTIAVHRLVALTFVGTLPDGWEVHHRNEDKRDNSPSNLELLNKSRHASLHNQGEKHPSAVLNDSKVKEIRKLIAEGKTDTQIAALFHVSRNTVNSIRRGKTWTHVYHFAVPKRSGYHHQPRHQFKMPSRHQHSFN